MKPNPRKENIAIRGSIDINAIKILESINKELNIVKIGIKTKSTTTLVF